MINVTTNNSEMILINSKPLSKLTLESSSIGVSLILTSKVLSTLVAYVLLTRFLPQNQVGLFLAIASFILLAYNISYLGIDGTYVRFATMYLLQKNYEKLRLVTIFYWKYVIFVSIPVAILIFLVLESMCGLVIPLEITFLVITFLIIRIITKSFASLPRVFMKLHIYQIIIQFPLIFSAIGIIIGALFRNIEIIFLIWIILNTFLAIYAGLIFNRFFKLIHKVSPNKLQNPVSHTMEEFTKMLIPLACIAILSPLNGMIDKFFITILVPAETIAIYIATFKLASIFSEVTRPFSQTLLSSLTYSHTYSEKTFKHGLGFILRTTLNISFLVLIVIIPLSPIIVGILYGASYLSGYILLPIFMACGTIMAIHSLFWTISIVIRKASKYLYLVLFTTIIRLITYSSLIWLKTSITLWIPLVLASLVLISHVLLLLLIFIFFKEITADYASDCLRILLLSIPFLLESIMLLNLQLELLITVITILISCIIYIILLLKIDLIKTIDLVILKRALPQKLHFLVNALQSLKKFITK